MCHCLLVSLCCCSREPERGCIRDSEGKAQQLVLEESPNWSLLSLVLEEVKKEATDNPACELCEGGRE